MNLKRVVTTLLAAPLALTLLLGTTACGAERGEPDPPSGIELKGAFVVEPDDTAVADGLDLSSIPDTRQLVLVVYDVENTTDRNWDNVWPGCRLSYESGNEYSVNNYDLPEQVQLFLKYDGYEDPNGGVTTIDADSQPFRSVAAFLVNKSDLESGTSGTLNIDYSNDSSGSEDTFEIATGDIKSITVPDEIFEIEDDPDTYQLMHSLPVRSAKALSYMGAASQLANANEQSTAVFSLIAANTLFMEGDGFSLTGIPSDKCPPMNYETIANADAQRIDNVTSINENLRNLLSAVEDGDYDSANTYQNSLKLLLSIDPIE